MGWIDRLVLDESAAVRSRKEVSCRLLHSVFFNRSAKPVKTFTHGLCLVVVALLMMSMTGCADNEAEATKLSKSAGDPGAPNPNAIPPSTQPQATTVEEYAKRSLENQQKLSKKGSGYPGAKK
jgi:hypothetical protein